MAEQVSFNKLVGTTLGNYRLEQLIEQNPWGPIFRATIPSAGKTYVVRFLLPSGEFTSEERIVYLGRFQKEANQIAALQHPNILPLMDYGNSQGMPYLVFPQVSAKPLSLLLQQSKPMDTQMVSRYLDAITAALEYAHQQGILHRNLTTDFVLVEQNGNLLVSDFGVMRILELLRRDKQGQKAKYLGEVYAPEQLLNKPESTATDVYALGALLYRMLTGHRVFRGKTREEISQQHLQAPVPPLRTWRNDLPSALDGVIATAMAQDPAQRFQQPGMLANAYAQIATPNDTTRKVFASATPSTSTAAIKQPASPILPPPATTRRTAQPAISRRQALTWIGAGGGAVVVVAAAVVFGGHLLPGGSTSTPAANTGGSTPTVPATNAAGSTPSAPTQPPAQNAPVLAHTADVPLNSAKTFTLPNNDPAVLVHLPSDQFVAFDAVCTHAGCTVVYNPQSKLLECPCHGANFDPSKGAAVVAGPAPSPLSTVNIKVNADGTITTG